MYDKDDGINSNIVSEAGEGQGWMLVVLRNYKVLKWIMLRKNEIRTTAYVNSLNSM